MIVKNSKLPRKYSEVARLQRESSRYQGYENMAVAIGLVNEPRYTKNGHLMWNLEDETGEMTCILTKKRGDERDRAQERVIEAGLMPDDVIGVSGNFQSNREIYSMWMTYISQWKIVMKKYLHPMESV
jgi:DNA polymerase II small subunit/DNA polymerase delta subunit B